MSDTIGRNTFETAYDQPPPWDIGRPQRVFLDIGEKLTGQMLDAGCGSGGHALFFAEAGLEVTGIDFVAPPIEMARQKARERGLEATFLVKDALTLGEWDRRFDHVIDCGLFHVFSDADRVKYVQGLRNVLRPGGRFFMLCFSDATPGDQGPRRVTRHEIDAAFAEGWTLLSVTAARLEVRPEALVSFFGGNDPHAWFVVARREA